MITVTGDGDAPKRIKKLVARAGNLSPAMRDLGGHWQTRVKESMPWRPHMEAAKRGKPPNVHDSDYVHSIVYEADENGVELGSTSIRARLLHLGGVVKARRAKYLTIPVARAAYGKTMRMFPGIQMLARWRDKGMVKMLFGIRPRGPGSSKKRGKALFLLVPKVTIQPHPHIELTADDWEYLEGALNRFMGGV